MQWNFLYRKNVRQHDESRAQKKCSRRAQLVEQVERARSAVEWVTGKVKSCVVASKVVFCASWKEPDIQSIVSGVTR